MEDPLNSWLYHSESFGPLLPGVLPSAHEIAVQPETSGIWLWHLMQNKAQCIVPEGGIIGFDWSLAAEALEYNEEFQTRAGGTFSIQATPLGWLFISERLSLWTGSDGEPPQGYSPYHFGTEHGRHLYVDHGYAAAVTGPLTVSLGRIPLRWGPGRFAGLLISGKAPAMDMLKLDLELGRMVSFSGFTATIDSDSSTWLSAHRLDIKPSENLRIGLSESILFSAGNIDLAYGNPLIPWYPVQWNERVDDNAFMCLDCSWRPLKGILLYGEFLIDDIQYENVNDVPNKLGFTAGSDLFHTGTGLGGVLEYTAVQRYVYSQRKEVNYYLHDDRIIGCQLGPDADRFTAELSWCGMENITAALRGSRTRQGEADVYEGWPDSVQAGGSFPSGVVETTDRLSLDLGWYPYSKTGIFLRGYLSSTGNTAHMEGNDSYDEGISLEVVYGQM